MQNDSPRPRRSSVRCADSRICRPHSRLILGTVSARASGRRGRREGQRRMSRRELDEEQAILQQYASFSGTDLDDRVAKTKKPRASSSTRKSSSTRQPLFDVNKMQDFLSRSSWSSRTSRAKRTSRAPRPGRHDSPIEEAADQFSPRSSPAPGVRQIAISERAPITTRIRRNSPFRRWRRLRNRLDRDGGKPRRGEGLAEAIRTRAPLPEPISGRSPPKSPTPAPRLRGAFSGPSRRAISPRRSRPRRFPSRSATSARSSRSITGSTSSRSTPNRLGLKIFDDGGRNRFSS
jgi:hypothetical protein